MELDDALIGKEFVHFKGGRYRLVGYAKDSETLEPMCVYEALYGEGGLWVRPAEMFFGNVDKPGYSGPRFKESLSDSGDGDSSSCDIIRVCKT